MNYSYYMASLSLHEPEDSYGGLELQRAGVQIYKSIVCFNDALGRYEQIFHLLDEQGGKGGILYTHWRRGARANRDL